MANNPYNNKVQLSDGTVLLDLTGDTITADDMLAGVTAHDRSGAQITGVINLADAATNAPLPDNISAIVGSSDKYAREDHVHLDQQQSAIVYHEEKLDSNGKIIATIPYSAGDYIFSNGIAYLVIKSISTNDHLTVGTDIINLNNLNTNVIRDLCSKVRFKTNNDATNLISPTKINVTQLDHGSPYSNYDNVYYFKIDNRVFINIGVYNLPSDQRNHGLFTLPVGYRPYVDTVALGECGTSFTENAYCIVASNGTVSVRSYDTYARIQVEFFAYS